MRFFGWLFVILGVSIAIVIPAFGFAGCIPCGILFLIYVLQPIFLLIPALMVLTGILMIASSDPEAPMPEPVPTLSPEDLEKIR